MRKFLIAILCLATLILQTSGRATAAMVHLVDGRGDSSPSSSSTTLKPSETAPVKAAISPAAKKHWKDAGADPDFQLLSKCVGAFTRPGAKQVAYLYSWCETGHSLGIGGVAIMENGKLVAHFGYNSGGEHDISRVPDIDGDGVDELCIEAGTTNQGYTISNASIISVRRPAVRKFGRFDLYDDNSGAVERNPTSNASSYSADVPTKKPIFMRQHYKSVKDKWVPQGKPAAYKPANDEVSYEDLNH